MVMPIDKWDTPISHYKTERKGDWEIFRKHFPSNKTLQMGNAFGYEYALAVNDLEFTVLQNTKTGKVWMSDTPSEYYSMWQLSARTIGPKVLIGGLGLGLLAHLLQIRSDIDEIVVVEIDSDICSMVQKYMKKPKIQILQADFFEVVNDLPDHFDTVIADIWQAYDPDDTDSMNMVEDCRSVMEDRFPDAVHLFWDAQYDIDNASAHMFRLAGSFK